MSCINYHWCLVAKFSLTLLQLHGLQLTRLLYPWDFRGKNTERVAVSLSEGSSPPSDRTHVSCIGRQILYQWATKFSSVQSLSRVRLFATPWITACQASLSNTNSQSSLRHPLSQRCHPATSSSVIPFSSCPQPLPASESFPMSQLFTWGGQSTGVSALASFLPKNTQDGSPSEWTD